MAADYVECATQQQNKNTEKENPSTAVNATERDLAATIVSVVNDNAAGTSALPDCSGGRQRSTADTNAVSDEGPKGSGRKQKQDQEQNRDVEAIGSGEKDQTGTMMPQMSGVAAVSPSSGNLARLASVNDGEAAATTPTEAPPPPHTHTDVAIVDADAAQNTAKRKEHATEQENMQPEEDVVSKLSQKKSGKRRRTTADARDKASKGKDAGPRDEQDVDTSTGEKRAPTKRKTRRSRLVWTPELHARFVNAVNHLGIEHSVPKIIMQLMNVEGLSRENVASHLQKYRIFLRNSSGSQDQAATLGFQKILPVCIQQEQMIPTSSEFAPMQPLKTAVGLIDAGKSAQQQQYSVNPYSHPSLIQQQAQQHQQQVAQHAALQQYAASSHQPCQFHQGQHVHGFPQLLVEHGGGGSAGGATGSFMSWRGASYAQQAQSYQQMYAPQYPALYQVYGGPHAPILAPRPATSAMHTVVNTSTSGGGAVQPLQTSSSSLPTSQTLTPPEEQQQQQQQQQQQPSS